MQKQLADLKSNSQHLQSVLAQQQQQVRNEKKKTYTSELEYCPCICIRQPLVVTNLVSVIMLM